MIDGISMSASPQYLINHAISMPRMALNHELILKVTQSHLDFRARFLVCYKALCLSLVSEYGESVVGVL